MNSNIFPEAEFFASSFLTGFLIMAAYETLLVIREIIPHGWLLTFIEDIIFWCIGGVIMFHMMYRMNFGIIRGFAIATVILGMLLYIKLIAPIVNILLKKPLKNLKIKFRIFMRKRRARALERKSAREQAARLQKEREKQEASPDKPHGGVRHAKRRKKKKKTDGD